MLEDVARKNEICADPTSSLQIGDENVKTGTGEENGFGAPTQGRLMRALRAQKTGDLGVPRREVRGEYAEMKSKQ